MTQPVQPKRKIDPVRLAAILDVSTIAVGIVAAAAGAGMYDARLGLITLGGLLLGAHVVAGLLRR